MHLKNSKELVRLMDRLNLREIEEEKKIAEEESKIIMQERRLKGLLSLDNTKKAFYITLNYKYNSAHLFITAAASNEVGIKQLGYLGMQLEPNENHSFLLINTLKKDLMVKKTKVVALNYLANTCERFSLFRDLLHKVDLKLNKTEYFSRELIAYYTLNPLDENIRVVEITPERLFVKLQILVDNIDVVLQKQIICENDIKYLQTIGMRTKDVNLLIKILQFLRLYKRHSDKNDAKTFNRYVESKIIGGRIFNKQLLHLALSLEASEFLLSQSYNSVNAHGFIFKLIEADEDYLNICAFRLIKKYNIHARIALHRIIEKGIRDDEHLETLLDIIDPQNCATLYNERCRSIQIMESKHIKKTEIVKTWDLILLKILEHCEEPLKLEILTRNLHLHKKLAIKKTLTEKSCEELFKILKDSHEVESFYVIYKLIAILEYNNLSHIYEKQLPRILDQYTIYNKMTDLKLFTEFIDCIYYNEISYYTHSFLHKTKDLVFCTQNEALIQAHKSYFDIINSMMVENYVQLGTGDFIYYTFELIESIEMHVIIVCPTSYNVDFSDESKYYLFEKVEDIWAKTRIGLYDFEAEQVSIKINCDYGDSEMVVIDLK